ncbi:hypothetical protein GCM10023339_76850 [Alloalcanivorax gelatiniphagus]
MSTYGTALVIDAPDRDDLARAGALLASDGDVWASEATDGWARLTVALDAISQTERITALLRRIGTARAVVAEDYDEFGAEWTVLSAVEGDVTTVHRRYLLGVDPRRRRAVARVVRAIGSDPRRADVPGRSAATAAARLFGVDPARVVDAEERSATAHLLMGTVGGPFPWWQSLGLVWPGHDAGVPVGPDPHDPRPLRMNAAGWPRFARDHVLPRLAEPDDWRVTRFGLQRSPAPWLLAGITVSPSSGDRFRAEAFVVPLYVPTKHVHHSHAVSLGPPGGGIGFDSPRGDTRDGVGTDLTRAITGQGVAHLDAVGSLPRYAALLAAAQAEATAEGRTGAGVAERLGYTLVLLDRVDEAREQLRTAAPRDARAPAWEHEQARRAQEVDALLGRDWRTALARLDAWAEGSASAVGAVRRSGPGAASARHLPD